MKFTILTLFPEYFQSPIESSILGRAIKNQLIVIDFISIRNFGIGSYNAVDDKPYGGGAGMLLMPEVLENVFSHALKNFNLNLEDLEASVAKYKSTQVRKSEEPFVVYLSPQGRKLNAEMARDFSKIPNLVLLCGHYEGIDERVIDAFVHEEVSVGDYVLTGGELAALNVIDSTVRFIEGSLGHSESSSSDTFELGNSESVSGGLKAAQYTRPQTWRGRVVPEVLLSGNHGEIKKWRVKDSLQRTKARRADLIK